MDYFTRLRRWLALFLDPQPRVLVSGYRPRLPLGDEDVRHEGAYQAWVAAERQALGEGAPNSNPNPERSL